MITRHIPKTPFNVSCVCLGTAEMGSVLPEREAFAMLDFFQERGGNFLDSALAYGDGASERTLGKYLRTRKGSGLILATKGGCPRANAMSIPRLSRAEVEADLDQSLENLHMDAIDIYYLHRDDPNRAVEEIIAQLEREVQKGRIRYYGLSNWHTPRLEQAAVCAGEAGHLVISEVLWSLAIPDMQAINDPSIANMDDAMRAFHLRTGLAAAPYTAQARGFFTKLNQGFGMQDWVSKTYDSIENHARLDRLNRLSRALDAPVEALVVAYLSSQPFPVVPIVSARNHNQLGLSLLAGNLRLSPGQLTFLEHGQEAIS